MLRSFNEERTIVAVHAGVAPHGPQQKQNRHFLPCALRARHVHLRASLAIRAALQPYAVHVFGPLRKL